MANFSTCKNIAAWPIKRIWSSRSCKFSSPFANFVPWAGKILGSICSSDHAFLKDLAYVDSSGNVIYSLAADELFYLRVLSNVK